MTFASTERSSLAKLMLELGPDAPTLCEGWTTQDMAVHLLIRENQPLAAGGMFVPALSDVLDKATAKAKARDYTEVVSEWAAGPAKFSPVRLIDPLMNTAEHFIHHEDVLRGSGEINPRELSHVVNGQLHKALSTMGRKMLSKSRVPVVLLPTDFPRIVAADQKGVSPDGEAVVRVSGDVGELLLWAYGRDAVKITVEGDPEDIKRSGV
ncbi:TIGR03085 family metal-binding protein [Corynebacterium alimapuense]|nr:TIGR03085 family metal-binding protein [Corynebacterium alimapuense]